MNQHLRVKMYPLGVTNPVNRFAIAGPMHGAQPKSDACALAAADVVGLRCDWRLDLAHFPGAANWPGINQRFLRNSTICVSSTE